MNGDRRRLQERIEELTIRLAEHLDLAPERQGGGVGLTSAAWLLLMLPLFEDETLRLEKLEAQGSDFIYPLQESRAAWSQARMSLRRLVDYAIENPVGTDMEIPFTPVVEPGRRERRSTFSVIKAFAAQYCDIPPFCQETEGEQGADR